MNERIASVLQNRWTIPASAGVLAFGAGFGVGYIWGRRVRPLEEKEDEKDPQLQFEFDTPSGSLGVTEQFYKSFAELKTSETGMVPTVTETVAEVVEEEVEELPPLPPEPETSNVFIGVNDSNWDYDAELRKRSSDAPYIIHYEEFNNDEMGYAQITITYYEGDDILTDDRDVPIYNKSEVVGELKFGHGSNDPNVCYVRNEKLHAEYEVLLHRGRYEEEVLGLTIEEELSKGDLKHMHKFRDD